MSPRQLQTVVPCCAWCCGGPVSVSYSCIMLSFVTHSTRQLQIVRPPSRAGSVPGQRCNSGGPSGARFPLFCFCTPLALLRPQMEKLKASIMKHELQERELVEVKCEGVAYSARITPKGRLSFSFLFHFFQRTPYTFCLPPGRPLSFIRAFPLM